MNNFIQRLFTNFFLLFVGVFILAASSNVLGQCEKITYKKSAFNTVSDEYRETLLRRFEMLLQNKCEKNFDALYGMLTSSFRQLNKREEFVKDMTSYYSDNDRFVSFNPIVIGESLSPKDNKPSVWFIEGCLTEVINGKKRSVKTLLEVIREDDEIFFTDITTRPNPLGSHQKCGS